MIERVRPDMLSMHYNLHFEDETAYVAMSRPDDLLNHAKFDISKPLVILITGWKTDANDSNNEVLNMIYSAYRSRNEHNFVIIDTGHFIDSLYTWSALNTERIGQLISQSLVKLTLNYPIEKIHLIGHSLGAHIAGSAGRHIVYEIEEFIPRITGLDPAST